MIVARKCLWVQGGGGQFLIFTPRLKKGFFAAYTAFPERTYREHNFLRLTTLPGEAVSPLTDWPS